MNDAIVTDGVTCNQCEWNTEIENVFCFKCYGDPLTTFAHFAINPTYDSQLDSRLGNLYCDNRYFGDLTVEGTCPEMDAFDPIQAVFDSPNNGKPYCQ